MPELSLILANDLSEQAHSPRTWDEPDQSRLTHLRSHLNVALMPTAGHPATGWTGWITTGPARIARGP